MNAHKFVASKGLEEVSSLLEKFPPYYFELVCCVNFNDLKIVMKCIDMVSKNGGVEKALSSIESYFKNLDYYEKNIPNYVKIMDKDMRNLRVALFHYNQVESFRTIKIEDKS